MSDIASLQIRINSLEALVGKQRLDALAISGGRAQTATSGLTSAFLRFAGPAAVVAGTLFAIKKASSVEREFGKLNAGLLTATGSAEKADIAFKAIEQFARNTPYDLAQATAGFTKLVNMGLDPSSRAMTSYGDTAAAMGKNLNDMVEAVADAATGEFERLKEFGIKAKTQGDQVSFTFRGVTHTVAKEAGAIEQYLIGLGETNFAGGMSLLMDELDGKLSNMGDSWDGLWRTINSKGLGDAMISSVDSGIGALDSINNALASGEMEASFDAFTSQFDTIIDDWNKGWAQMDEDTEGAVTDIVNWFSALSEDMSNYGSQAIDWYLRTWSTLPIQARYWIQRLGIEISSIVDYAKEFGGATVDVLATAFSRIAEEGGIYFDFLKAKMFFEDYDLQGALNEVAGRYTNMYSDIYTNAVATMQGIKQARIDELDVIEEVKLADLASYDSRIKAAKALTEAKGLEDAGEEGADPLAQFRIIPEDVQEDEIGFWDRYLEAADTSLTTLDDLATNVIDRFSQGAADAFTNWVTGAEDSEQSMDNFLKSMVTGTISALAQMGAQWLAYQAVQMLTNKTTMTGAAVALTAEAQAASLMAGLHAFSSTAAIPVVGPPAAPAAMGAALAVTQPMAYGVSALAAGMVAGAFDEGGHIPAGQVGILGEYGVEIARGPANITSREDTLQMMKNMNNKAEQKVVNNMTLSFNVSAIDTRGFENYLEQSSGTIIGLIQNFKESTGGRF